MTRLAYVRFDKAVMTPGRGGNTIQKAKIRSDVTAATTPRDELMEEILLDGDVVILRALRQADTSGKLVIAERRTNRENCVDWEELPDAPEPKTKGNAR